MPRSKTNQEEPIIRCCRVELKGIIQERGWAGELRIKALHGPLKSDQVRRMRAATESDDMNRDNRAESRPTAGGRYAGKAGNNK